MPLSYAKSPLFQWAVELIVLKKGKERWEMAKESMFLKKTRKMAKSYKSTIGDRPVD